MRISNVEYENLFIDNNTLIRQVAILVFMYNIGDHMPPEMSIQVTGIDIGALRCTFELINICSSSDCIK